VIEEFDSILRFWFDRGVDGFRIDVANSLVKHPELPDLAGRDPRSYAATEEEHPFWDRDLVHEIFRSWRAIADDYPQPKVFVAEAWVGSPERLARYVRPGHLHSAFNFDFLRAPWRADALRQTIDEALAAMREVEAQPTWVLSNHDVARHVTRFAYPQGEAPGLIFEVPTDVEPDLALGARRARAAVLLMLALPGGAYVYQGEELGLWEVDDLPEHLLQDPTWKRSGMTKRGRDGCRVPLPWLGDRPPFGFGRPGSAPPWLPQPAAWATLTAEAQSADPASMLELYRAALRLRREHPGLGSGQLAWRPAPAGALAFEREHGLLCVVNLDADPFELPAHRRALLASEPISDGHLRPNTAAWLQE
jgi:alpha-glucosidase